MEAAAKSLPSTGVGFTALLGYLFAQPLLGCESTCVLKPQQKLAEGDWTTLVAVDSAFEHLRQGLVGSTGQDSHGEVVVGIVELRLPAAIEFPHILLLELKGALLPLQQGGCLAS